MKGFCDICDRRMEPSREENHTWCFDCFEAWYDGACTTSEQIRAYTLKKHSIPELEESNLV